MTRTVLVTGATGFVGRAVVSSLAAKGWKVRAASRDVEPPSAGQAGVVPVAHGDLTAPADQVDWGSVIGDARYVVHLAGIAHATTRFAEDTYMTVNCRQTEALAKAAAKAGVARVVFASSIRAQSGPVADDVLDERTPPRPSDSYGRSKLAAEQALANSLAASATDWSILRPVVIYGTGVKGNLRALMRLAASPLPLPLASLGGRRSLLELAGMVDAIEHCLSTPATARRTFVVADETPVTLPEILRALRAGLGRGPGLIAFPVSVLGLMARMAHKRAAFDRLASDLVVASAALAATGWVPQTDTSQALSRWAKMEAALKSGTI